MPNFAATLNRSRGLLLAAAGVVAAAAVVLVGVGIGAQQGEVAAPESTLASPPPITVALQDRGPAPEFSGIGAWMNGEKTTLAGLRGQVVLIDFWTLGCINCRRTLPYVRQWHDRYAAHGLKVIGVHTPEFAYEKDHDRVLQAMTELGVTWTVAIDNHKGTWYAWRNRWWPRKYLIDSTGTLRYDRIGEGAYEQTEQAIRLLLEENGADLSAVPAGGRI